MKNQEIDEDRGTEPEDHPIRDKKQSRSLDDKRVNDRLDALVAEFQDEASRRVSRRQATEHRWLQDLRQYHGQYEPTVKARLAKNEKSQLFINKTRPKTNAMSARITDLLFPTDDRNWGISPTPVPELARDIEVTGKNVDAAKEGLIEAEQAVGPQSKLLDGGGKPVVDQQLQANLEGAVEKLSAAEEAAERMSEIHAEAKKRSDLMMEEIDDQFKASDYQAQCRDMIDDSCKLGIGVIKGPVIGERMRKRWQNMDGAQQLQDVADNQPTYYRVSPWDFFPDPDCQNPRDGEGVYERHLYSEKDLKKLARRPDMDREALARLIVAKPKIGAVPHYYADLSNITGETTAGMVERFHVWEYRGQINSDQLHLLAEAYQDDETIGDIDPDDPLAELDVTVWFCDAEVLSFAIHPLDSGESLYSTFCLEKDETSPFGYGIPYLMRDDQSAKNAAWRMMLDNAGVGTGPQIVINKKLVEPEDGDWTIRPFKIWMKKDSEASGTRAFEMFDPAMHQVELANIINMADENMDDSTSMPEIAQGEQGAGVTKTAQGMALLMNSANVVFRRVVKNFDDDVTVPNVRRAYDWNMQFSTKDEIKGDYDVDARGSSVLLVREMQATNLMMIALQFGAHPIFGPMTKHADIYRSVVKAHGVPVSEVVKTDRELKVEQQQQQDNGPDPAALAQQEANDLKRQELELKVDLANMENDTKLKVAQLAHDATMSGLAEKLNMSRDALNASAEESNSERSRKERGMAVEVAMAEKTGKHAGGSI